MTSYSIMSSGYRFTVLATWASVGCDQRLPRIEQQVAACQKFGGRATVELAPDLCAQLVVPWGESVTPTAT